MNFLAHAYLSFGHNDILAGNMMSDFVKGNNNKNKFPPLIQKGIVLHRLIDQYTDEHPATIAAKQLLKPQVGLYAGAFLDVVYDYFLANDKQIFPAEEALQQFSFSVYDTLQLYQPYFPEKFNIAFQHMQTQNWLLQYRYSQGIARTFEGMIHRAQYLSADITLLPVVEENYYFFEDAYRLFFPDVIQFASKQMAILLQET
ncbi:ACP phosphodiesterase [Hydrotalea sp.]|uniref:acyl carrier protein phosphodiesterase n=1 Tax=Hydrotalea sp. TaxID=2881279 RepID=UPI003D1029B4